MLSAKFAALHCQQKIEAIQQQQNEDSSSPCNRISELQVGTPAGVGQWRPYVRTIERKGKNLNYLG